MKPFQGLTKQALDLISEALWEKWRTLPQGSGERNLAGDLADIVDRERHS